ncbi:hypothetical protein OS493_008553 [Desmophyllum pertusum]|uniref:Ig-like domain-containing protein n=1 Tax=Desmophyllum pertusum TaxID=174260 RepID=A0A9X0D5H1_9CNID|nr:hypothetical protein OS493_008553 [Desmophyllum pertusum]
MVVETFLLLFLAVPFTQADIPAVAIDGGQEQFVAVGNEILLTCRYNASPPATEVQWIKDGTVIARNASVQISDSRVTIPHHNESQVQLSIINVTTLQDAGNYTCLVINDFGNSSDTTSLFIEVAPEISKDPKDATRVEGQDVVFSCSVEGNPPPSVRWTMDGETLNTTANSRLPESVMNNNHSLTITDVHRSDAGQYRCVANNSVDNSTSLAATLKVYFQPEFTSNPQNKTIKEGEIVILSCTVVGVPAPDVIWTKDGQTLPVDQRLNVSSRENTSTLTITNVVRGDQGLYRCVANNSVNTSTSYPGMLTVNFAPEGTIDGDQKQFVPVGNENTVDMSV